MFVISNIYILVLSMTVSDHIVIKFIVLCTEFYIGVCSCESLTLVYLCVCIKTGCRNCSVNRTISLKTSLFWSDSRKAMVVLYFCSLLA